MNQIDVQQHFFEAIYRLLNKHPIEKITVRDIVNEAGVSRSSFYRNFYDKYDLLNKYYDSVLEKTLYLYDKDITYREATSLIYNKIKEDLKFYQNAFKSNDANGLKNHIFKISQDFHMRILERKGITVTDWKVQKVIDAFIFGNLEIMCIWILHGMKEPIEEMQDIFELGIPENCKEYF